jgi:hypothetical protein
MIELATEMSQRLCEECGSPAARTERKGSLHATCVAHEQGAAGRI